MLKPAFLPTYAAGIAVLLTLAACSCSERDSDTARGGSDWDTEAGAVFDSGVARSEQDAATAHSQAQVAEQQARSPESDADSTPSTTDASVPDGSPIADSDDAAGLEPPDGFVEPDACVRVSSESHNLVGIASAEGEYALTLRANSLVQTEWQKAGNEALILEVHAANRLVGHLVLHQGSALFDYSMHLGRLTPGAEVRVSVSPLSAPSSLAEACIVHSKLLSAAELGARAEGLSSAPLFLWPQQKRFDDLPMLVGWSRTLRRYEVVYSNENGGTAQSCGGGSRGIQALIGRWGRAADVELAYDLAESPAHWLRCSGRTDAASHSLRYEGNHPVFYYGDGHNRLFESRGGYGRACGSGQSERTDGELTGFNVNNPGVEASLDDEFVLRIRPLPVALDDIPNFVESPAGRREALIDQFAPWLYRITFSELEREGKIDNARTFAMQHYVFMDVRADNVGGRGDSHCSTAGLNAGFKMRLVTADGKTLSGPQITADYFPNKADWKRIAFPLDRAYLPEEITSIVFDAYDNDGVYFLALGDVFIAVPEGLNSATLRYLHRGVQAVNVYVDDDSSGCSNAFNHDGPAGGPETGYPCVGGSYHLPR